MSLEVVAFFVISCAVIASAVLVISSKEIFHSALYLAAMLLGVAGIFLMLNAEFLAAIQVLVYTGAIVVLILFAIMLTRRETSE